MLIAYTFAVLTLAVVIDLCRLIIGYCSNAYSDRVFRQEFFKTLFKQAEWSEEWGAPQRSRDTNILLLMRGLANAFQDDTNLGDGVWVDEVKSSAHFPQSKPNVRSCRSCSDCKRRRTQHFQEQRG